MKWARIILVYAASIVLAFTACSSRNPSTVKNNKYAQITDGVMLQSSTSLAEHEDATTVYIAPYGKRYHYSQRCAGKNAMEVDVEDVVFKPCKKCVR